MTDEANDTQVEAEVQAEEGPKPDLETVNESLQSRIAQLEEAIAARDADLAALKESLAVSAASYRDALLATAPGVPEEMVKGETVEELDASLEQARGLVARIRQDLEADVAAKSVPAGAPPRTAPDVSALSPGEKIAHALANA
jgi:multidrug resistance efflux pump